MSGSKGEAKRRGKHIKSLETYLYCIWLYLMYININMSYECRMYFCKYVQLMCG